METANEDKSNTKLLHFQGMESFATWEFKRKCRSKFLDLGSRICWLHQCSPKNILREWEINPICNFNSSAKKWQYSPPTHGFDTREDIPEITNGFFSLLLILFWDRLCCRLERKTLGGAREEEMFCCRHGNKGLEREKIKLFFFLYERKLGVIVWK